MKGIKDMTSKISKTIPLAISLALLAPMAFAHGDTAPQAVDTTGLPDLPEEMASENPWREADDELLFAAIEVGAKGFNSNCARCHGLEAISGGLAPDVRFLEADDFGDEWYLDRVLNGYEQNGAVKMPPFSDILSQEAIWAIRTYIESRPDADELLAKGSDIKALHEKVAALGKDASPEDAEAVATELEGLGSDLEPLSGAPRVVSVLDQAAYILRTQPSHAPTAAELLQGVLRN